MNSAPIAAGRYPGLKLHSADSMIRLAAVVFGFAVNLIRFYRPSIQSKPSNPIPNCGKPLKPFASCLDVDGRLNSGRYSPITWRPSNKPQRVIDEIEVLWRAGGSIRGIAKKYGMSRTTVLRMVRSYGWERVVTEGDET